MTEPEADQEEAGLDFLQITKLARKFVNGDIISGEILLQMSGTKDSCRLAGIESCIQVLNLITDCLNEGKICEIAISIVANLLLFDETRAIAETQLNLPESILACYSGGEDPFVFTEGFRVMTNLIFYSGSTVSWSREMVEALISHMQFVIKSSLEPKLLAQACQLLYYCLSLLSGEAASIFYEQWDSSLLSTVLCDMNMLTILKQETICSCSGLEWLLLSVEQMTTVQNDVLVHRTNEDNRYLAFLRPDIEDKLVLLLLNPHHSFESFESLDVKDCSNCERRSNAKVVNYLATAVSLSNSEKFVAVSILQNLVFVSKIAGTDRGVNCGANEKNVDSQEKRINSNVFYLMSAYVQSGYLLRELFDLWEESVLLRDSAAMECVSFLLLRIFDCTGNSGVNGAALLVQESAGTADVSKWLAECQRFIGLLAHTETTMWIHQVAVKCGTNVTKGDGSTRASIRDYNNICVSNNDDGSQQKKEIGGAERRAFYYSRQCLAAIARILTLITTTGSASTNNASRHSIASAILRKFDQISHILFIDQ